MPSKPLRTSPSMPRMPWMSMPPSTVAETERSWMLRCWATAAMPAVRQAPRPTSTYSTGVGPLSSAAKISGWSASRTDRTLWLRSSPRPKKPSTVERLWTPFTQLQVVRQRNRAASGAAASASRAPRSAPTLTPLSAAALVASIDFLLCCSVDAMTGRPGDGDDELARQPVAVADPVGGDGFEVLGVHGLPRPLAEPGVGEGHRSGAEHRLQRLVRGGVAEGRGEAFRADLREVRGRERPRQRVPGAEVEEHRADLRRDPRVGDREDLGPAAVAPRTPDGRGRPAAGLEQAAHLAQRPDRVGDVHEPERAGGGVEAPVHERQLLGLGALEAGVVGAPFGVDAARGLDHLARDVGADDRAPPADGLGHAQADQPGAAGHVEHPIAGPQGQHVEHQGVGRLELVAPAVLVRRG